MNREGQYLIYLFREEPLCLLICSHLAFIWDQQLLDNRGRWPGERLLLFLVTYGPYFRKTSGMNFKTISFSSICERSKLQSSSKWIISIYLSILLLTLSLCHQWKSATLSQLHENNGVVYSLKPLEWRFRLIATTCEFVTKYSHSAKHFHFCAWVHLWIYWNEHLHLRIRLAR